MYPDMEVLIATLKEINKTLQEIAEHLSAIKEGSRK